MGSPGHSSSKLISSADPVGKVKLYTKSSNSEFVISPCWPAFFCTGTSLLFLSLRKLEHDTETLTRLMPQTISSSFYLSITFTNAQHFIKLLCNHFPIYLWDFFTPFSTLFMFHIHNFIMRLMKIICYKGCFLVKLVLSVPGWVSPWYLVSTSKIFPHLGHSAFTFDISVLLIVS